MAASKIAALLLLPATGLAAGSLSQVASAGDQDLIGYGILGAAFGILLTFLTKTVAGRLSEILVAIRQLVDEHKATRSTTKESTARLEALAERQGVIVEQAAALLSELRDHARITYEGSGDRGRRS